MYLEYGEKQMLGGNLEKVRNTGGRGFGYFSRGARTNGWAPYDTRGIIETHDILSIRKSWHFIVGAVPQVADQRFMVGHRAHFFWQSILVQSWQSFRSSCTLRPPLASAKCLPYFPKQCLHYGVLAFSRAGKGELPVRGSRTRKIIKKT